VPDLTCHGPEGNRGYALRVDVQVRLFAGLRERAGFGSVALELPEGATVGDVWAALALGEEPPGLLFALNRAYAERDAPLAPGDEVALIPPVSGGSFRLSAEPLSVDGAVAEVRTPEAGAVAVFVGTTRSRSRGREVLHLEYEAYEGMAEQVMADLAAELERRHDLCRVAIHHRVGRVEIGDVSVVIAVSAPHRAAALAACREAIDELKVTVPLWKKEVYIGGEEWIGQGS
jgi:molybdopterin synthase catalytic subunit/molybdopterin converting factor small subunit